MEALLFDSDIIFSDYMDHKFNIKKTYDKDTPMYYISKLLMNGLYGRFGMDSEIQVNCIVTPEESEKLIFKHKDVECIPLPSGNVLISYIDKKLILIHQLLLVLP